MRALVVKLHNSMDESVRGPSRTFLLEGASAVEQALTHTTLVSRIYKDQLTSRWKRVYILPSSTVPSRRSTTPSSGSHRRRANRRLSPSSNEEREYPGYRGVRMIDGLASSLLEMRPYLWLTLFNTSTVYLRPPRWSADRVSALQPLLSIHTIKGRSRIRHNIKRCIEVVGERLTPFVSPCLLLAIVR